MQALADGDVCRKEEHGLLANVGYHPDKGSLAGFAVKVKAKARALCQKLHTADTAQSQAE